MQWNWFTTRHIQMAFESEPYQTVCLKTQPNTAISSVVLNFNSTVKSLLLKSKYFCICVSTRRNAAENIGQLVIPIRSRCHIDHLHDRYYHQMALSPIHAHWLISSNWHASGTTLLIALTEHSQSKYICEMYQNKNRRRSVIVNFLYRLWVVNVERSSFHRVWN